MQGLPHGYNQRPPRDLSGDGHCPHCLFAPCIVAVPPDFVCGQSGPHICNNTHRYRLYRQFWKALKELGLWNNSQYLARKREVTLVADPREIIPLCIVNLRTHYLFTSALNVLMHIAGSEKVLS